MLMEIAGQTIASGPDNIVVTIDMLPNVVFLGDVASSGANTVMNIQTYRVQHLLYQTNGYL
jgi:hypothetical protein